MRNLGVLLIAVVALAHAKPQGDPSDVFSEFSAIPLQIANTFINQGTKIAQTAPGEGSEFPQDAAGTAGKEFGDMEKNAENVASKGSSITKDVPKSPEQEEALKQLESVLETFGKFKETDLKKVCNPEEIDGYREIIKQMTDVKKFLAEGVSDKATLAKKLPELCDKILSLSKHLAERKDKVISSGSIPKDQIEKIEKKIKELTTNLHKLAGITPPNVGDSPNFPDGVSPDKLKSLDVEKIFKSLKQFEEVKKRLSKSFDFDELAKEISSIKEKFLNGKLDECKSVIKMAIRKIKMVINVLNSKHIKDNCPEAAKYSDKCKSAADTLNSLLKEHNAKKKNTSPDGSSESSATPDKSSDGTPNSPPNSDESTPSNGDSDDGNVEPTPKKSPSPNDDSGDEKEAPTPKKSPPNDNSGDENGAPNPTKSPSPSNDSDDENENPTPNASPSQNDPGNGNNPSTPNKTPNGNPDEDCDPNDASNDNTDDSNPFNEFGFGK